MHVPVESHKVQQVLEGFRRHHDGYVRFGEFVHVSTRTRRRSSRSSGCTVERVVYSHMCMLACMVMYAEQAT